MSENTNTATRVLIGECRLSYVHLFKPEVISEGNPAKYSVSIIIPKTNTELVEKIKAAIVAAYQAGIGTFGGKLPAKGTWKNPLRDGDTERPDDPAYAGAYFINASSKTKPGLVKKGTVSKFTEITDENELYSGCFGYVSVNFYAFSQSGNKGIGAGLNNVLKTKDGDFLGGRVSAETDFDGLDVSGFGNDAGISDDDVF